MALLRNLLLLLIGILLINLTPTLKIVQGLILKHHVQLVVLVIKIIIVVGLRCMVNQRSLCNNENVSE